MRITLDKDYIESWQMDRVKEDVKAFKEMYKEEDLLGAFRAQVCDFVIVEEILKTKVEAFDSGWAMDNKTVFRVEMVVDAWNSIYKIRFYVDMGLAVDTRDLTGGVKMYDIKEYKAVRG